MFRVDGKHFAWAWLERVDPKKARVENRRVLVVRVAGDIDKQMLLAMDRKAFFTEPHYDGYAAVLIRLAEIDRPRLKELITNAWRLRAPAEVGADATRSDSRAPRPRRAGAGSRARPSRPRRE